MACAATCYFFISIRLSPTLRVTPLLSKYSSSGSAYFLLLPVRDCAGKKVLVTAGATREDVDGIRFISNYSSGKMGIEIAKAVKDRGGSVVLVAGFVTERIPDFIDKVVRTESTADMLDAVLAEYKDCDVIIKAAAPADYSPAEPLKDKATSASLTLELVHIPDIANAVACEKEVRTLLFFCPPFHVTQQRARSNFASNLLSPLLFLFPVGP